MAGKSSGPWSDVQAWSLDHQGKRLPLWKFQGGNLGKPDCCPSSAWLMPFQHKHWICSWVMLPAPSLEDPQLLFVKENPQGIPNARPKLVLQVTSSLALRSCWLVEIQANLPVNSIIVDNPALWTSCISVALEWGKKLHVNIKTRKNFSHHIEMHLSWHNATSVSQRTHCSSNLASVSCLHY